MARGAEGRGHLGGSGRGLRGWKGSEDGDRERVGGGRAGGSWVWEGARGWLGGDWELTESGAWRGLGTWKEDGESRRLDSSWRWEAEWVATTEISEPRS